MHAFIIIVLIILSLGMEDTIYRAGVHGLIAGIAISWFLGIC